MTKITSTLDIVLRVSKLNDGVLLFTAEVFIDRKAGGRFCMGSGATISDAYLALEDDIRNQL